MVLDLKGANYRVLRDRLLAVVLERLHKNIANVLEITLQDLVLHTIGDESSTKPTISGRATQVSPFSPALFNTDIDKLATNI